ncbi:type IV pilus assembly protein PilM [Candidatus Omnitrophota bacterium]
MFKNLFQKKSKKAEPIIGLDIGNHNIKVVELDNTGENYLLKGIGCASIASQEPAALITAIKEACSEAKVSAKKVNTSIFSEGAILRYLLLPEMTGDELQKAMRYEIERYVPFGKEEVVSDYQILKQDAGKKNMKILLVAAKKEFVEKRASLIQDAGLEPQIITIDAIALKNPFKMNYPDKKEVTVGLLNLGAKITNINIVRDDASYFMRDIQIGGDNITNLIKEQLEVSFEKAESLKRAPGEKETEIFKIIEPVLGNLLNEIYLSFDYYESEFGMVVDEVYVCGGTSQLKWLQDFLRDNLGREILPLDIRKQITIAKEIPTDKLVNLAPLLPISVGLAMESFF